jgi:2-iminobutanoate/2-iminopropanoate deaminase
MLPPHTSTEGYRVAINHEHPRRNSGPPEQPFKARGAKQHPPYSIVSSRHPQYLHPKPTNMKIIQNKEIPVPKGHYSPVIEHNGTLYLSGQLPKDEDGNIPEGIEAQLELVLAKMDHLLTHSGSDRNHVLSVRIYIPDVAYWDQVDATYASFFGDHRPARCVVPSRELHHGCLVELEAVACVV